MRLSFLSVPPLLLAACANERAAEPTLGTDACEHFSNGPERAATAGASAPSAVDASEEHSRWDLILPGTEGQHEGFVKVAIGEAGEHVFFFDGAVGVAMTDANGAAVSPASNATSDADCATVRVVLTFELEVGSYTLTIDGAEPEVSLVWFGTADEHGE